MERAGTKRWTRRDALAASVAAGGGTLLAGAVGARSAPADHQVPAITSQPAYEFFGEDPRLNSEVLFAIGAAGYGAAEFGEISTAIDRIRARGPSADGTFYDAVHAEFHALGVELRRLGRKDAKRGLVASARTSFLHAAKYLTLPLFFVRGTSQPDREAGDYRIMQGAWHSATRLFSPRFERIRIPYPGRSKLPAYFLRPAGRRMRRPTVILNNGNDAQNVDLFAFGGAAALERGWNALIFEGPGQGSMWFLRRIPFRPDWQRVIGPVVDYLRGRSDVAHGRIAAIGWSQGAELVAKAAAHDRRLAALVLDPGAVDVVDEFHELWEQTGLLDLITAGRREQANAEWAEIASALPASLRFEIEKTIAPFGGETFYDTIRRVMRFRITGETAKRIEAPALVTQYELDTAVGPQARPMFDMLRTDKKLVVFGASRGAQFHDAPMAPQRRNQVVFDWLERHVG